MNSNSFSTGISFIQLKCGGKNESNIRKLKQNVNGINFAYNI